MKKDVQQRVNHSSHWGAFLGRIEEYTLVVDPPLDDPRPSPILQNIATAVRHPARVHHPMARRGWLEHGPGRSNGRGKDEFVRLSWPEATERVAAELQRVYDAHGAEAVFGGSYGWASAGRFHHAQSQIHRFLNTLGGYVRSQNTYSAGAAMVILPRVLGDFEEIYLHSVRWDEIVEATDLVLSFGGMAAKNQMICGGGTSRHVIPDILARARQRGTEFHLVSALRDDFDADLGAHWHAARPGTDTALMLGLAHALVANDLHDRAFLNEYCTGYPAFEAYLTGRADGQAKDAVWASAICGLPAGQIRALAMKLAEGRTLISVSQSIQRAEHGEQPIWMAIVLAAMLGQIGLPGGGFCYGLGSMADCGNSTVGIALPRLAQGTNPVTGFIPVARIADMLLHPGEAFDYDGQRLTYPDIKLVYWAGGNPFHHHQDLGKLIRAFERPETIIVHETAWTASARHADIVLPATMTVEREDIAASRADPNVIAMHKLIEPVGEAKDDYDIFAALAHRLHLGAAFTQGRDTAAWLRAFHAEIVAACAAKGHGFPDFDSFWAAGSAPVPLARFDGGRLARFRADPVRHPLATPSGRIEIFSPTIAGFGYDDCPGHPVWLPPSEGVGSARAKSWPIQLIANQPATRLHSQLDFGATSLAAKIRGREPMRLSPADAAERGIADGDIVRVFNDRGAFLAAAVISDALRKGVAQIATGAWFDPQSTKDGSVLCGHGNPNAVTRDAGTSRLAQGTTGQLCLVEIECYDGPLPPMLAHQPPCGAA
ncbi:molybdopterin-dependent oxidoreductase [Tropicimonas sp. IMCC34043]|uniref:molybdopterin-dependent oxidoreductase n=1 Tax=Tropicimonas sp. IMCC34043 TaxID=2248760 RepID=UPI000E252687|nr:molybdopterin-dependent oxidoreductase [Tropicimonas sp. IMCC34043]